MSFAEVPLRGEIAASHAGDLVGWRAEVGARIHDFLVRKAVPATERLGTLVRAIEKSIEGAVSPQALKTVLSNLLHNLRREKDDEAKEEAERALVLRIVEYRRRESIENYGAYLFTVNVL
jgi:hypothetical protein